MSRASATVALGSRAGDGPPGGLGALGRENGNVSSRWRRWIPGSRHGLARGVAVYGVPGCPDLEQLGELLGRCGQLRAFARAHGFELDGSPEDLGPLDQAIDEATDQGTGELGGPSRIGAALTEAGLFLGSVIVATVAGVRAGGCGRTGIPWCTWHRAATWTWPPWPATG
jgi:Family of unknown function (DUF6278)